METIKDPGNTQHSRDRGLLVFHLESLNYSFYNGRPHDYLITRYNQLFLYATRSDEVEAMLDEGMTYGPSEVRALRNETETPDQRQERADTFVSIEADALYHQSAEAALRFYLAHQDQPLCPWMEIARLRRGYGKQVEERFLKPTPTEEERREKVALSIIGDRARASDEQLDAIESALAAFAFDTTDETKSYNAIKHGLGVRASQSHIMVKHPDGDLTRSGIAIRHVKPVNDPSQDPDGWWAETMRWSHPETLFTGIRLAIQMMDAMWQVGRWRYTAADLPTFIPDPHPFLTEWRADRGLDTTTSVLLYDQTERPNVPRGLKVTGHHPLSMPEVSDGEGGEG